MIFVLPDVVFDLLDQLGEVGVDRLDRHPLQEPDGPIDGGAVERVVEDLAIHRRDDSAEWNGILEAAQIHRATRSQHSSGRNRTPNVTLSVSLQNRRYWAGVSNSIATSQPSTSVSAQGLP
jgi:hypothetical protein